MDVSGLISSFATSSVYVVSRVTRGTTVRGRVQSGTASSVSIVASVSPATGADIMRLPEGRRVNEARVIFTTTPLYLGGPGSANESDKITIDGDTWEVFHVETWNDSQSGAIGYRCIAVNMK